MNFKIFGLTAMILISCLYTIHAQSQMELLNHWAPEVYHDINTSSGAGRQFYSARDIMPAVDFDGDWYAGNNWNNSHFQVWEQGQLSDRMTPPMRGVIYSAFVETQNFYFLTYGIYHTGDDSNLSADRHENDWEGMHVAIEKDGSLYGVFRGAVTEFHKEKRAYVASDFSFTGSHPRIYVSANGVFDLFSTSKHGHGVETFTGSGYQGSFGSDAVVFQVAERHDNIYDVSVPGSENWSNVRRYDYKLIPIQELWNRRGNTDLYNSYTGLRGGVSGVDDGGTVPWGRGYFASPIQYFSDRSEFDFLDVRLAGDSYVYNPFFGNIHTQTGISNPSAILPPLTDWNATSIGSGSDGKVYAGKSALLIDGKGADIWGTSDQFYYVYKTLDGDGSITAKVHSLQAVHDWTKAGLMIRESLDANAKNAFVLAIPDNKVYFSGRSTAAGSTGYTGSAQHYADDQSVYLRLTRQGSTFTAAWSPDGSTYTTIASRSISMSQNVYVGLAVTSHQSADYALVAFDKVSVTGSWSVAPEASAFPLTDGGVYEIVARHSGRVLDVAYASEDNGANVQQYDSHGGTNQQWVATDLGDGYWRFDNANSNKALDVNKVSAENGATIIQWGYWGGSGQQWQLVAQGGNDFYHVISRHSGKCLDISGGSVSNNADVIQWECSDNAYNQQYTFIPVGTSSRLAAASTPVSAIPGAAIEPVEVFPNPVTSYLTIILPRQIESAGLAIYDQSGKLVMSTRLTSGTSQLKVAELPDGLYLVKVQSDTYSLSSRFIKK